VGGTLHLGGTLQHPRNHLSYEGVEVEDAGDINAIQVCLQEQSSVMLQCLDICWCAAPLGRLNCRGAAYLDICNA
jgi:hypothetical protein